MRAMRQQQSKAGYCGSDNLSAGLEGVGSGDGNGNNEHLAVPLMCQHWQWFFMFPS